MGKGMGLGTSRVRREVEGVLLFDKTKASVKTGLAKDEQATKLLA
jgi:hypothetical protein